MGIFVPKVEQHMQIKSDEELAKMTPEQLVAEHQRLQKRALLHTQESMKQQSMATTAVRSIARVAHFLSKKLKA